MKLTILALALSTSCCAAQSVYVANPVGGDYPVRRDPSSSRKLRGATPEEDYDYGEADEYAYDYEGLGLGESRVRAGPKRS